jgi:hypothetical protein
VERNVAELRSLPGVRNVAELLRSSAHCVFLFVTGCKPITVTYSTLNGCQSVGRKT